MFVFFVTVLATNKTSDKSSDEYTNENQNIISEEEPVKASVIAAGDGHTLTVLSDGSVWAWGSNASGQLGNGTETDSNVPVKVTGLSDVISVFAGKSSSAAVKKDGSVWAWGGAVSGLISRASNVPVRIEGVNSARDVCINDRYSIIITRDNTGFMRKAAEGELGEFVKISAEGFGGIEKVVSGAGYVLILCKDKTVWGMGRNSMGQLGDSVDGETDVPVKNSVLEDIVDVGAGALYSIALKSDGTVYKWGKDFKLEGNNDGEQLKFQWDSVPVAIDGLGEVKEILCGQKCVIALKNEGTLYGLGANEFGVLGGGVNTVKEMPAVIEGIDGVTDVETAGGHAVAVKADGSVWTWGWNYWGQLGDGTNSDRNVPVKILDSIVSNIE